MKKFIILLLFSVLANTLGGFIFFNINFDLPPKYIVLYSTGIFGVVSGAIVYLMISLVIKFLHCRRHHAKTIYSSFIVGAVIGFNIAFVNRNYFATSFVKDDDDINTALFGWIIDKVDIPTVLYQLVYLLILYILLSNRIKNLEPDFEKEAELQKQ